MITPPAISYELADKEQAIAAGGIGAMVQLTKQLDLRGGINYGIKLFKMHLPYDEAEHVMNISLNLLAGGNFLDHLADRRQDEAYLNAVGAHRIPDPTTDGDFCRRFDDRHVLSLISSFNRDREKVWKQQPDEFFECAVTVRWAADLDSKLFDSLLRCGLVEPRRNQTKGDEGNLLGPFLDAYIAERSDVKGGTVTTYKQTRRLLCEYFGERHALRAITPADADRWRRWLLARPVKTDTSGTIP